MPLALLDPRLDLASLAEMGDAAADFLMESAVEPSDVALMFGQGFKVSRRGEAEQHWHLPRSCFARYAGNAFGEERQAAVESWRVAALPGHLLGEWIVEQVGRVALPAGHGKRHSSHRSKAAAGREWRRCILREFPEIERKSKVGPVRQGVPYSQTLRAWEFVAPEPEIILVGDRVTLDGEDRVRRAEEGDPIIGVAITASDAYHGTVLVRRV
jgi:hypothetical protein